VPHRGKLNDPAKVVYVAEKIAELKGLPLAQVAKQTSENFFKLFNKIKK
jgi:TatD DNase family protein